MDNNFAPIGVCTYNRLHHLKQTIHALKQNILAKDSVLYIFSDAPQKDDEATVNELRNFLKTISGFKEINIVERKTNDRINNCREGLNYLLNTYGKAIFLEDDIITSKFFLKYLNDSLVKFENDKRIFSISAFNVPINFDSNEHQNLFISFLFNSWGWATWKNRNPMSAIKNNNAFLELDNDALSRKIRNIHPTLHLGLKRIYEGQLDAGDYKVVFHLIKNNMYVLKPKKTLVKNIGFDSSGVHCGKTDKFNINIIEEPIIFHEKNTLNYNIEYDRQQYYFFNPK